MNRKEVGSVLCHIVFISSRSSYSVTRWIARGKEEKRRGANSHQSFPNVISGNNTLSLIGECFVCRGEEVECFFDFGFLFGADVVFFGEFGLARSRLFGCWGGGCASAFLWGLFTHH